jgi:uncharacterized membrane protein
VKDLSQSNTLKVKDLSVSSEKTTSPTIAPDIKELLAGVNIKHTETQHWESPYPPPDICERMEKIYPGFIAESLQMAKKQMSHRHKMENTYLKKEFFSKNLGQIAGGIVSLGMIVAGALAPYFDHPWGITISLGGGLSAILLKYLNKDKNQKNKSEREEKINKNNFPA